MEIVASISIIGLVGLVAWQGYLNHKERIELAKVYKAKDLQEVEYLFPSKEEEVDTEVDTDIVDLEEFEFKK